MKLNYIDIHSHLNLSPLLENKDQIIQNMRDAGIGTITVGTDYETSKLAVEMANDRPDILWATVGQHPNDLPTGQAGNPDEVFDYEKYLELAKNEKVVAIGETGLDYFRDQSVGNKERQKELFIKHIELALEVGKPLMIHARPAKNSMNVYEDVLDILESCQLKAKNQKLTVNFHFFVGDIQ